MKTSNEERLEELEEVVQHTVNKVQQLENRKIELPEINIPDYSNQFNELKEALKQHNLTYPATQIQAQLNELQKSMATLPKVIPVRHYHHFEKTSKGLIISATILILACTVSIGIAISTWRDNHHMNENSVKFRMIRQNFPKTAYWADTVYHQNPEAMKQITEKLEAEQLAIAQAEATAKLKAADAVEAKKKVNELKKKK